MNKPVIATIALFLFAIMAMPSALAYNGDGLLESYTPTAVSVGSTHDLTFVLYNDATDTSCIDEIIITAPASWGGTASVTQYTRGGITVSNEADAGDYINVVSDNQSVRIIPDAPLCAGERVTITVSGLVAPGTKEISEFEFLTSDQSDSGPSPSYVRYNIDNEPVIYVTRAKSLKLEYLHIKDFTSSGFTGKGTGAWGRLDELIVSGSTSGTVDVYVESGENSGLQVGEDILIGNGLAITGGTPDTLTMDYSSWSSSDNVAGKLDTGYVADGQEWKFYFDGYGGVLSTQGHTDEPRAPVPSNSETGLFGARGTILNVDYPSTGRTINVQLIDSNGWDVNEENVPITFETDLGYFVDPAVPQYTDSSGNKYLTIRPDCEYGVAEAVMESPGLTGANSVTENVGINAGAPVSFEVTKGKDAEVVGGTNQEIEVTVYDSCGNVVTDTEKPNVEFDLTSTCNGLLAQDPSNPPSSHYHEEEQTTMGIAQVFLVTTCDLCTHEVDIAVEGLSTETIQLLGIVGNPYKMVVTADTSPDGKMTADECIDVTVEVTDVCGNRIEDYMDPISGHMQQWESIVRVEIVDPLMSPWSEETHIDPSSVDFREPEFISEYDILQGKLNYGVGHFQICGCQGLGQFDIIANSDTLLPGEAEVDVVNAEPSCIDVGLSGEYLLVCDETMDVDVSIIDICGNKVIDQDCLSGPAYSCVDLMLEGKGSNPCTPDDAHLSTDTVCVDLAETGEATTAEIIRDTENCCELEVTAVDADDCCLDPGIGPLPQCEPKPGMRLIGYPDYMTTTFESKNPANQELVDQGQQVVSEEVIDNFAVYDQCGWIVPDFGGNVDVELVGEDCASFIEVKSPAEIKSGSCTGEIPCSVLSPFGEFKCVDEAGCDWQSDSCVGNYGTCADFTEEQCKDPEIDPFCDWIPGEMCEFEGYRVLDKVVIDNCAEPGKQWTDLEEEDIVVDKLAFETAVLPDPPILGLFVYKETEAEAGFQMTGPNADVLVGRAPWMPGEVIIELLDTAPYFGYDWYSRGVGYDDQREGGVLIRAGDSKDFYVVLKTHNDKPTSIHCGTYEASFMYYQDYNSPDITDMNMPGEVRDHCTDSDNHNWIDPNPAGVSACGPGIRDSRNDDYVSPPSPYPGSTPDYGFGDRVARNIQFCGGEASVTFRDLVAEHVDVYISNLVTSGFCDYEGLDLDIIPNPEPIDFISQPATQVVLINHEETEKTVSCDSEWDPEENAFLLNLQTADGFQNPHGKEIEVQLEYCLKEPFGDTQIKSAISMFCGMHPKHEICKAEYMDGERCFTREDLRELLKDTSMFGSYMEEVFFGDYFGEELSEWIDRYFENAKVEFWDSDMNPLPIAEDGNAYVMTDANGQAQVYVTSAYSGIYKVIARPTALDADYTFVSFDAGIPAKLDLVALPSFGVPADGEEEAMLLLRVLDECNNVVYEDIPGTTVTADGEQVFISEDFESNNNYDNSVTGELVYDSMLGETDLRVLSDLPQTSTITASAYGLESDTTSIAFQGAPRKLVITEISPSDRLPADAQTGAWVTVEVQDKHGNRVTGYLGQGFSGDPGDPWGYTDFTFENICVEIGPMGFVPMGGIMPFLDTTKFGWKNFHMEIPGGKDKPVTYCGDLMFGKGSFYVVYDGEECNHGGTLDVDVFDLEPFQGQEMNENGIPSSLKSRQLTPDHGEMDFVDPATQWNIWSDKVIVPADGSSKATLSVQVENPYMDIRQAVKGNVYIGGTADEGAVLSWEGDVDPHNPTSARIVTDPVTGRATLELTSTEPGIAEVTITGGQAYVCMQREGMGFQCPQCEEVFYQFNCHYNEFVDLEPKTITVEFLEVEDSEVYLETGWNFISVPYELDSSADEVGEIFDLSKVSVVYGWDSATQSWVTMTTTDELEPLNGYWVKMLESDMVSYTYAEPSFPSIPTKTVNDGWEAVGLTWNSPMLVKNALISIDNSYSQLIGWDSVNQKYELPVANTVGGSPMQTDGSDMYPKRGYWIWVTEDTAELAGISAMGG